MAANPSEQNVTLIVRETAPTLTPGAARFLLRILVAAKPGDTSECEPTPSSKALA